MQPWGRPNRIPPGAQVSNHTLDAGHFAGWHRRCEKDERPQLSLADVDAAVKRLKAAEKCARGPNSG